MKTLLLSALLSIGVFVNSAFAAAVIDTAVVFNSGILVIAFAGFLALVVVVQTIPALISLYGMIKAAAEVAKEKELKATN